MPAALSEAMTVGDCDGETLGEPEPLPLPEPLGELVPEPLRVTVTVAERQRDGEPETVARVVRDAEGHAEPLRLPLRVRVTLGDRELDTVLVTLRVCDGEAVAEGQKEPEALPLSLGEPDSVPEARGDAELLRQLDEVGLIEGEVLTLTVLFAEPLRERGAEAERVLVTVAERERVSEAVRLSDVVRHGDSDSEGLGEALALPLGVPQALGEALDDCECDAVPQSL